MKKASRSSRPARGPKTKPATVDLSDLPEVTQWSTAVRGRFYTGAKKVLMPVFVEPDVMAFLSSKAAAKSSSPSALANELLRRDIELIRAAGG